MEIQGVDTTHSGSFPFSALRVLGSLQIFIGVVCIFLGIGDLAYMLLLYDKLAVRYTLTLQDKASFQVLVSMTVASAPVWCGTWFLFTGSFGACVSRSRSHSLKILKITFLVLSVLCATFFAPACTVLSSFIAYIHLSLDHSNFIWLVSTAIALLSICQTVVAVISASVCCCCSPVRLAKVQILSTDRGTSDCLSIPIRQITDIKVPDHHQRSIYRIPVKEVMVQTDPPPKPAPLPLTSLPVEDRRLVDPRFRLLQSASSDLHDVYDSSPSSASSYDRLRKWALPHDRLY